MSAKKHPGGPHPVPPGNRPQGPGSDVDPAGNQDAGGGEPFSEKDPKGRLGGYGTAGEHTIQQPGMLNDGDRHSK